MAISGVETLKGKLLLQLVPSAVQVLPVEDEKEANCIWDSLLEKRMLAPCTPNMCTRLNYMLVDARDARLLEHVVEPV